MLKNNKNHSRNQLNLKHKTTKSRKQNFFFKINRIVKYLERLSRKKEKVQATNSEVKEGPPLSIPYILNYNNEI